MSSSDNLLHDRNSKMNSILSSIGNFLEGFFNPCLPDCSNKSETNRELIERGIDVLNSEGDTVCKSTAVCKFSGSMSTRSANRDQTSSASNVNTLEDSFRYFNFDPSLQMLEENLEDVRRRRKTVEDHELLIKRLEKNIIEKCKEHHPDKIQGRGGTDEEMSKAQRLQAALNSTKKAINILGKLFLEDLDIDHKYGFYTNLDISHLGNEDEIESHVYEVLFKISLISEIKQRHIISVIRNFLMESQSCIKSCISGSLQDFEKYLSSAIFRLKQCIGGYKKLLRELEEIEKECIADEPNNTYVLIKNMRDKYSEQLVHLKNILKVVDRCLDGNFQIFTCSEELDDYFVCPFACYIDVILMCKMFLRKPYKRKSQKIFDRKKNLLVVRDTQLTDFLDSLYHLILFYYFVDKSNEQEQSEKENFFKLLLLTKEYLMNKFKIEEYNENGSKRYIFEELKKCQEMKSEFNEKKKELEEEIASIKENNKKMMEQLDKINSDREERQKEYQARLAENDKLQEELQKILRDRGNFCKEFGASSTELQAKFALVEKISEGMNQQVDKINIDID